MEENVRILSQIELARCTRGELHTMLHAIAAELPHLADGSADLRAAHANLEAIRRMLARPELRPR